MKHHFAAAVAAVGLLAGGAAVAQTTPEIDDECRNQAEAQGLATTHNVRFDEDRNVCVAWLIGTPSPLLGAPALVGLGTTPVVAAGLVTLTGLAVLAGGDSDTPITTPVTTPLNNGLVLQ